jgi:outer membrane cobalamin receptor
MAYVRARALLLLQHLRQRGADHHTNLNLEPERARSNEVNIAWQSEYLLLSASGYYNTQSDLLITAQSEAPENRSSMRRCSRTWTGRASAASPSR